MFARSTTVQAHPNLIDAGVAELRDHVMPALLDMDGCIGVSMLCDRASGRCIATSAWESKEAMDVSDQRVRPMRDHFAEVMGGMRAQVDAWEIASLHRHHRTHEGTCCRVTWMRFDASTLERSMDIYKMALLPKMEAVDGFCSASLMADRGSGIACLTVTFDSRQAMEGSRGQGDAIRATASREAGVDVLEVAEFELAVAHLRVPEMA